MRRFSRCILIVFAVGVLLALPYACLAQNPADTAVALKRLSPPVYPAIALTAHVQGDVELLLQVRMDGSVESATVVSGPPLLLRASLSSAQQSQFDCLNCVEELTPYRLVYTYRIDSPPDGCKGPDLPLHRARASHRVVAVGKPHHDNRPSFTDLHLRLPKESSFREVPLPLEMRASLINSK